MSADTATAAQAAGTLTASDVIEHDPGEFDAADNPGETVAQSVESKLYELTERVAALEALLNRTLERIGWQ